MVNYHILQYFKENGFGTDIDVDLFFEKLPVGAIGIAIISRGGERATGRRTFVKNFDLYCRGTDDLLGADMLDKIGTFLSDSYHGGGPCTLPFVPEKSNRLYTRARFTDIGDVENLGQDENDRVIYRLSARIRYSKSN